jgi:hypothetical protein
MRLSYVIELVLALAAGLALERASPHDLQRFDDFAEYPRYIQLGIYLVEFGDPFCAGMILVEGAAVWIEVVRSRTARTWGFGRLTWSIMFCVVILTSLESIVWNAAREAVWTAGPSSAGTILRQWRAWFTHSAADLVSLNSVPLALVALLLTSVAARWPRDPSPDAREWSGRILFGIIVILYLTHRTLAWYWE